MTFLGIDVGTTAIKALVVNEKGEVLERLSHNLKTYMPEPAWAEQDPKDWWDGVVNLLEKVSKKGYEVDFIGLSGQMHSLVVLDEEDRVIRPAILWSDQRTSEECKEATEILGGEEKVISEIGNPILEGFTLPKLLWLRKHEPQTYEKIRSILLPKDYISFKLTGNKGVEWSDASGTACYDVFNRKWDERVLEGLKIKPSIFPPIYSSTSIRGDLNEKIANSLDWKNTKIVSGGADNAVAALGIGVCTPGDCMVSIGTSGTVLGVTSSAKPDHEGKIHLFNHVLNNISYYMGVMLSATNSLDWFKKKFAPNTKWEEIEKMVRRAPAGSHGMIFLPYLNGERTPYRNPNARGVLFGISSLSNIDDIFRATFEGVAFGLRDSFELIKEKANISRLRAVGGGAENATLCEIIATNFKMPVEILETDEGGAYGAAMLAAIGSGMSVDEAQKWVKVKKIIEPKEGEMDFYDQWYDQYKNLYLDLKKRFRKVASITSF